MALAAAFVAFSPRPAAAQRAAAIVNGEPITELDIAQRRRLIELASRKAASHQQALDELINEKLKLQTASRYKLDITDAEINAAFANMARRARYSPEQFVRALTAAGLKVDAFRTRIKADMAWQQIVRGKFRGSLHVRERDIASILETRNKDDEASGYEYTLRPILLLVPSTASDAARAARRREAEGLRNQFQNCQQGLRLARALRDVAIRDSIVRTSADFTAQLRELLDRTPVGRLTPPELTQQGIELYAVCAKEKTVGAMPGRREVQEELMQKRFEAQAERYLQELRRSAMIEYR